MPTISIFYGIQIMMYFYDNGKHNMPHIHAEYQDDEAVFSILDGDVISSSLPRKRHVWYKPGLSYIKNL
jgi:Domain of unknown function (DUF4160)